MASMDLKWRKRLDRDSKCKQCAHYREEYASYEEGGYLEELECSKRPGISNLWSFPFIKPQACFVPDFWFTEFADQLTGEDKHDTKLFKEYAAKYIKKDKS